MAYLALGTSLLLTAAPAHAAAGRSFAFVESCRTTPHRHVDVELWGQTYGNADYNLQAVGGRIGYGVTDRLDLSVELEFDQGFSDQPVAGYGSGGYILDPGLAFARVGARYRLSDPGRWPLDVCFSRCRSVPRPRCRKGSSSTIGSCSSDASGL